MINKVEITDEYIEYTIYGRTSLKAFVKESELIRVLRQIDRGTAPSYRSDGSFIGNSVGRYFIKIKEIQQYMNDNAEHFI